jgi:hypothetical protein
MPMADKDNVKLEVTVTRVFPRNTLMLKFKSIRVLNFANAARAAEYTRSHPARIIEGPACVTFGYRMV